MLRNTNEWRESAFRTVENLLSGDNPVSQRELNSAGLYISYYTDLITFLEGK